MKKIYLQIISALLIILVVGILAADTFKSSQPERTIEDNFALLSSVSSSSVSVTDTRVCAQVQSVYPRAECLQTAARDMVENRDAGLVAKCVNNLSNQSDRVVCVAAFAERLAVQIDKHMGQEYVKIYSDVCKNLPGNEWLLCQAFIQDFLSKDEELPFRYVGF
jgi:hypothetical protein